MYKIELPDKVKIPRIRLDEAHKILLEKYNKKSNKGNKKDQKYQKKSKRKIDARGLPQTRLFFIFE